jgi:predicted membrane protein
MTNGVRANAPYLVVGLCFMLLGVLLVLDRLGTIRAEEALRFWPLGLVLLGGSMMVQAMRGGGDTGAGTRACQFPLGAIFWLVVLGLLFSHTFERRSAAVRNDDRERVSLFAVMSADRRTSFAEHFSGGEMTSIMGGTQLDLRQATLATGEEAVVDILTVMGGAVLHIPDGWTVDVQTTSVMGGVKDERGNVAGTREEERRRRRQSRSGESDTKEPPAPQAETREAPPVGAGVEREDQPKAPGTSPGTPPGTTPPRLVLRGFVMMGGLIIRS